MTPFFFTAEIFRQKIRQKYGEMRLIADDMTGRTRLAALAGALDIDPVVPNY
jgi:hypothetical protein